MNLKPLGLSVNFQTSLGYKIKLLLSNSHLPKSVPFRGGQGEGLVDIRYKSSIMQANNDFCTTPWYMVYITLSSIVKYSSRVDLMSNVLNAVKFKLVTLELNKTLPTSFKKLVIYSSLSVANLEGEFETFNKLVK